jgi:CRP-like cAMP-binding protein
VNIYLEKLEKRMLLVERKNSDIPGLSQKAFPPRSIKPGMHEIFFEYLREFNGCPVTDEDTALITKVLKPLVLRRKQYYLQAGDQCKFLAFIVKGAVRQYFINRKGNIHMACLGIEKCWIGDRESYARYNPSIYHIEAVEDTEMLVISRSDFLDLLKIPGWCQMQRELDTRNIIANQQRIDALISDTAEKRYRNFVASQPGLCGRFSQHDIASYLGVNKDTLCRIKRQLSKTKGTVVD